jgi:hypothetical protein
LSSFTPGPRTRTSKSPPYIFKLLRQNAFDTEGAKREENMKRIGVKIRVFDAMVPCCFAKHLNKWIERLFREIFACFASVSRNSEYWTFRKTVAK